MFDVRGMQEQVLLEAIEKEDGREVAEKIVHANKHETNAEWVDAAMSRLEADYDADKVKSIRMNCQCGYGMEEKLALLMDLKKDAHNLEELASSDKAKQAGLFYQDGELYLQFFYCPCPMLAEVKKLRTKAWCQCTTGYSKALFEKAFGCEFDVILLKSIKSGDDICLMKMVPHKELNNTSW